jgi:hypothetical protein
MLRQLGNVFIVQPEILKSYLNESWLSKIENRLLRPFVMMRSDYNDFGKKFWDDIFGDTITTTTSSTTGAGVTSTQSTTGGDSGIGGFARLGTIGNLGSLGSFSLMNNTTSTRQDSIGGGTFTTGMDNNASSSSSLGRKQSLFGNLMKDFEGLGLKDDSTNSSEFGSKRASMI